MKMSALKAVTRRLVVIPAVLALAASLISIVGAQTASGEELLPPDPTSSTGASGCVGSVVTFYGHEFYPSMTALFGSYSTSVYGIVIPIGDNDTAQATVPNIPTGTYTLGLHDNYGTGTDPDTFTVVSCPFIGPATWENTKFAWAFDPPLTKSSKGETSVATGTAALTGGASFDHDYPTPGSETLSTDVGPNSCSALAGGTTETTTLNINWSPDSITSSTVTFTGFEEAETSTGDVQFTFGGSGVGTSVTGSYAGTDGGASSEMTLTTSMTSAALTKACDGKNGLKSIKIVSGTLALG